MDAGGEVVSGEYPPAGAPLVSPMSKNLVWPNLVRPSCQLLYLDLNHFINLAKAEAGKKSPAGYDDLLAALAGAISEGRILVPLSGQHAFEMSAITDPRQRGDVAKVMERLTRFQYLLGRTQLAEEEMDAGIRRLLGEQPFPVPFPLLRETIGHAFGMKGGVQIVDGHGSDVSEQTRHELGDAAYFTLTRSAYLAFERAPLAGPSDAEVLELRAKYGYRPEVALESHSSRLEFEVDFSEVLSTHPEWRTGRLRDVISAREFIHEWTDALSRVNRERHGRGEPTFDPDAETFRAFAGSMPHSQVAITLKTRYHRDPKHRWTVNDIADIDAISVAFAYCDAVYTDKAIRNALASSPELRSIPTFLPRTPAELSEWVHAAPLPALGPDFLISVARPSHQ